LLELVKFGAVSWRSTFDDYVIYVVRLSGLYNALF